jgi:uncharacterized protein (TIGR02996 family)
MSIHRWSDEELTLLAAIHAQPRNDAPRLAYADWLEKTGKREYAEFIRLQLGHKDSVMCGEEKRHYISDREQELLRLHKQKWSRPVPRFLRPFLFSCGLPTLQFRMDLHTPTLVQQERLTGEDLDQTLATVNPRVRFAMVCCETPYLPALLQHRFFSRVDILAVVAGPEYIRATGSWLVSPASVRAVAACPYLGQFWSVQFECRSYRESISDEMRAALKDYLPPGPRINTEVGIDLISPSYARRGRRRRFRGSEDHADDCD